MEEKSGIGLPAEVQDELKIWARDQIHQEDPTWTYADQYDLEILEPNEKLKEKLYSGKKVVIDLLKKDLGEEIVDDFLAEIDDFLTGVN